MKWFKLVASAQRINFIMFMPRTTVSEAFGYDTATFVCKFSLERQHESVNRVRFCSLLSHSAYNVLRTLQLSPVLFLRRKTFDGHHDRDEVWRTMKDAPAYALHGNFVERFGNIRGIWRYGDLRCRRVGHLHPSTVVFLPEV